MLKMLAAGAGAMLFNTPAATPSTGERLLDCSRNDQPVYLLESLRVLAVKARELQGRPVEWRVILTAEEYLLSDRHGLSHGLENMIDIIEPDGRVTALVNRGLSASRNSATDS
jgi:diadenosine tetraphosphatase ApaH/serine/threonine PP2A family protein phosphatase